MPINYSQVSGSSIVINHDSDNKEIYSLVYRPNTWTMGIEVIQDSLIVIPSVSNGCMYSCSQGGVTGTIEPIWSTARGSVISDGTAKWTTLPYNLTLNTGDTVQSYTLISDVGVTIDNSTLTSGRIIRFRVTAVPVLLTIPPIVTIICRTVILTASGIETQHDNTVYLNLTSF
jgi:hypothetical protein